MKRQTSRDHRPGFWQEASAGTSAPGLLPLWIGGAPAIRRAEVCLFEVGRAGRPRRRAVSAPD